MTSRTWCCSLHWLQPPSSEKPGKCWGLRIWASESVSRVPPPCSLRPLPYFIWVLRACGPGAVLEPCWNLLEPGGGSCFPYQTKKDTPGTLITLFYYFVANYLTTPAKEFKALCAWLANKLKKVIAFGAIDFEPPSSKQKIRLILYKKMTTIW